MDMKEFTELLDDFGKLSDEQISEKFYDILDSLFDVIRKDVKTAGKKTEQDTTNTETVTKDTETVEDTVDDNEQNEPKCSECSVIDCASCDKKCCGEDKSCCTDTTYDDEKNDYFTRIGNILTDWIKPWVTQYSDDKDNSGVAPRKFDYEINEVLKHDGFNVDSLNDKVFDILDTAVFKMLVVGHNKTCKLTITWKLENDYTYTFTFFWDPETCAFYGYMNNYTNSIRCLKYNEQTRGFDTLYKTELSDYIKGVLSSETSCSKNTSADTVSAETETTNTVDDVNTEVTPAKSRKDTAANIYKRYNTSRPINHNSGEIWDRIIKATDQLFDYGDYTPESANGETYAVLFFPQTVLDEDDSLPDDTFDRLNYDDYKDVLKTRYGFPLVTVLDEDMSVGIDELFIRCYLK